MMNPIYNYHRQSSKPFHKYDQYDCLIFYNRTSTQQIHTKTETLTNLKNEAARDNALSFWLSFLCKVSKDSSWPILIWSNLHLLLLSNPHLLSSTHKFPNFKESPLLFLSSYIVAIFQGLILEKRFSNILEIFRKPKFRHPRNQQYHN